MTTKRSLFVRLVPCRCLRGEEETVTTLDYSHCSLEQVPKEIFTFEKTLEELYLDANQIEELPKQLFNCQSLHKLSLPDNDLTTLPASIANLINLRELDVSKNGIQEFPENIKNCKVLTIVEASVNPISKYYCTYFNKNFISILSLYKISILELKSNLLNNHSNPITMNRLTQLERLDLGSNEFTEVPEVLEQLSGLKEFWMDANRLTFIPGFIGSLKQLTYLDVSKNNIEMVEEGISTCENLQDLLLSSNSLQQLPETIGSLKNITTLKIDENQLMYLPDSIGGLISVEELDCSFNEVEALPSSIGQLTNLRTFAADHNYLQQLPPEIGSWKNITVLFLHSNKLETLPEEMGDMQKLKVINLSDNRLKNLPFSFTKLQQLTAMWLSDNQSKPLIPLQKETDSETQKMVLTNYMFPQQPRTEDVMFISDNESFNPSLWEEQRKQRAQVAFECDEDKDEREAPPREGNLKRYPTPYPDELKNMVKTVQTIVHRLKDEETNEDSGRDLKPHEDQQDINKDTSESTTTVKSKVDEREKYMIGNSVQKISEPEAEISPGSLPVTANMKASENLKHIVNHDDVFEESEELSSDEEMKMAEMRPPLIETSINQPKVVALSNNKKDDTKETDSLSDEVTHNSNQNNSNCSSPSRMSDSVSLNTDSSQDTSLCSPVKQTHIDINSKIRQEDENFNSLLQNGDILNNSTEEKFKAHDKKDFNLPEYDLNVEERLVLIEKSVDSTATADDTHKLDHINMNLNKLITNDTFQPEIMERSKTQDIVLGTSFLSINSKEETEHLENGNKYPNLESVNKVNGHSEETSQSPNRTEPHDSDCSVDLGISKSTEDLSPQKSGPVGSVVKSHSITNMEIGGLKIYDILSDNGPQQPSTTVKITSAVDGKNIVRSKSATLLYDQPLQVFTGSSSSSDLISGTKAIFKFDSNHNPEEPNIIRGPTSGPPSAPQIYGPPQYNIQYSSSAAVKDTLWHSKQNPQIDHASFPPQLLPRSESTENQSYAKHSANMNFSNHNNVRANTAYHLHQRLGPARHGEMWAISPNDRLIPAVTRSTIQRQSSVSSTASVNLGDPGSTRRAQIPEGDYLSYREFHSAGRTPPMMPGSQRPLSARTYSIDGPNASRPQSARPSINEIPERTMSVSDFNYSRTSPSKRPNARVGSEHSLLDPPGKSKVPHDWREQVLRHIEAKKLEKMPLSNGQMGQPLRPQANYSQIHHPPQASVARHPSREQLIDYLMLKVAHQPPYTQPHCSPRQGHELAKQEIRVRVEKDPELGFSISGGVGGRGNPFRPDDDGIFVTRVQPEGPASKLLQPGDKIIQANGYSFINIEHGQAVSLLKTFQNTVELIIVREVSS
uniref:Erbb2 interacting protein n=2 Tax=Pan TaxID=9596 RepID=A0A2I3T9A4_PANTR